ncbi:hypothetical protein FGL91_15085 [Microbacterium sp. CBA3102]|uniref:hypothetical protein n=1 Tax=Microbacterium sp. CBA3102 TaxID=2603598 RepID=UPI0011BAEF16|nr:hypothetical protein [Microbacterium sp. CBA3102]QEA29760.1 hypothetical protein FGL91_15085 [Microbacterium sp. CBA3102]
MPARAKFFVFKPVAALGTFVAAVLTILLPSLQGVAWVNEHAVWTIWVALLMLTTAVVLLHARLAAVQKVLTDARADAAREKIRAEDAEARAAEARMRADLEARKAAEAVEASTAAMEARMGESDRALADKLNEYASDATVLNELADFFPYKIPRELVNVVRELSELPRTRAPHNPALKEQLSVLSDAAEAWFGQFLRVAWTEDEHYSTKLDPIASMAARKEHEVQTDKLVQLGFDLHSKLLGYQQYHASLETPAQG